MTPTLSPLSALAVSNGDIAYGLELMVVGMGVVFGALVLIMCLLFILTHKSLAGKKGEAPAPRGKKPAAKPAAPVAAKETLSHEEMVALTASVAAAVENPFRIKSIKLVGEASSMDGAISAETMVVISAAIAAAVRKPFSMKSVRPLRHPSAQSPWATRGRTLIHRSHLLRKGSR